MTLNNRANAHRMLKARQGNGQGNGPPFGRPFDGSSLSSVSSPSATLPSATQTQSPPPPTQPSTSRTSPSPTPTSTPTTTKTETTTQQPETTKTSSLTSSDSPSTSQSSSPSTSVSASVSSVSSSVTSQSNVIITTAPVTKTLPPSPVTTSVDSPALTVSPSTTAKANSSGISTGAIVGSVGGGIAGLVVLAMIIAFILRRFRRRRHDVDVDFNNDDPTEYNDGPLPPSFDNRVSTFDPQPPSMAQRNAHMATSSISSGPGLAGHGAYFHNAGIQERTQYVYGQGFAAAATESGTEFPGTGAYSSQPQPQAAYNSEAYSSYAYTTDGPYATSQAPGGHGGYEQYQNQNHQAAPALVSGGPAIAAARGAGPATSSRHAENDDDAYGGI